MKKILILFLVAILACSLFVACENTNDGSDSNPTEKLPGKLPGKLPEKLPGDTSQEEDDGIQLLSFAQTMSVDNIKDLNGKQVQMMGYMSTLSPINGKFMYLMNLPYQSCPFCIPNTSTLSNTIAVYAKDGKAFEFNAEAILVTGILEVGEWKDEFGYEYEYRIKDADYTVVKLEDLSDNMKTWQALAASGVIADVYAMFDYVNFVSYWTEYTAYFGDVEDYLYPDDVHMFLQSQFSYVTESYFDDLIAKIEDVDATAFGDLVAIIRQAESLNEFALSQLQNEEYTRVKEYSGFFNDERPQFMLNNKSVIDEQWNFTYGGFSSWLANWEL